MKRVLFQGDSITDCGRNRNDFYGMGNGYPYLAKGEIELEFGEEYEVLNRGVSGNRITDLIARIKCDILNLNPDYMSILIGINDIWHDLGGWPNGVDTEDFEFYYDHLLTVLKTKIPHTKIAIMEPYVFENEATRNTERIPDKWERFKKGAEERAAVAKKLAEKHGLAFIPLQEELNKAVERIGVNKVTADGVHPAVAGHIVIKNQWMKWFKEAIKE